MIMSNKLAPTLGAAFILSTALLATAADADWQYHGGPKSNSSVSVTNDCASPTWPGLTNEQAGE
jgi:hypothetical protein